MLCLTKLCDHFDDDFRKAVLSVCHVERTDSIVENGLPCILEKSQLHGAMH